MFIIANIVAGYNISKALLSIQVKSCRVAPYKKEGRKCQIF